MKHCKIFIWLRWTLAVVLYYAWFQTFYNAVRFGNVFPYTDLYDMFEGIA